MLSPVTSAGLQAGLKRMDVRRSPIRPLLYADFAPLDSAHSLS